MLTYYGSKGLCNDNNILIIVTKSLHAVYCSHEYGAVAHAPVLYNLSCTEQSRFAIHDCTFNISQLRAGCDSVLGVECYPQSNCTEGAIRLVDGTGRLDGRFEVCVNGFWGVVPGRKTYYRFDPFSVAEFNLAARICRQLGLPMECKLWVRGELIVTKNKAVHNSASITESNYS